MALIASATCIYAGFLLPDWLASAIAALSGAELDNENL
jgi:hypothetical protein